MNNAEFLQKIDRVVDWGLFTKEEMASIADGSYSAVSKDKMRYLENQYKSVVEKKPAEETFTTGETLGRQAERQATGIPRALAKVGNWIAEKTGGSQSDIDLYNKAYGLETEAEKEGQSRIMWKEDPALSMIGAIAGGVADPTSYLPLGVVGKLMPAASSMMKGAATGAVSGAISGAVTPTYEEYGEGVGSIAKNTLLGAGLGGIVGGMMGKFLDPTKSARLQQQEAADAAAMQASKVGPTYPTAARVEENLATYEQPKVDMNVPGAVQPVDPQPSKYIPPTYNALDDTGAPEVPTFKTPISVGQDFNNPTIHPMKGEMYLPDAEFNWYDKTSAKLAQIGVDVKNYDPVMVKEVADELGIETGAVIRKANATREWAARLAKVGVTEEPKSLDEALEQVSRLAKEGLLPNIC